MTRRSDEQLVLPYSPDPRAWEPLGMYLMRCAVYVGLGVGELLAWIGLPARRDRPTARGTTFGASRDVLVSVARAFSRDVAEVRDMTYDRYQGELFDQANFQRYGLPPRAITAGCFACLRDGLWDLRWASTLVTVCLRHLTYLEWRCPLCGMPFGPACMLALGADEPFVAHGPLEVGCLGPSEPAARAHPVDIHASTIASRLLADAVDDDDAARRVHHALRLVRVLRDADHWPKSARGVGSQAVELHRLDVRTAIEAGALAPEQAAELPHVRRAVAVYARRPSAPTVLPPAERWSDPDPVAEALDVAYANELAVRRPVVVPAPGARGPLDVFPAVVPPELISARFARLFDGVAGEDERVLLAVAVVQSSGSGHWIDRAAQLGLSERVAARAYALAQELDAAGAGGIFWAEVSDVRDALTGLQVPFRARLESLERLDRPTRAAIEVLAAQAQVVPQVAREWLVEHWACHPLRLLQGALGTRSPRPRVPELERRFGTAPWRRDLLDVTR